MKFKISKTKLNMMFLLFFYLSVYANDAEKFEAVKQHHIKELASLLNISVQTTPDTPSKEHHFFKKNEDTQLGAFLFRPRDIQENHTIFDVYNGGNKRIAWGHYYEMPSIKSAQLCLLEDLSCTSMPLFLVAKRMQVIKGIGDLCVSDKGDVVSFLSFTRNGSFVKLKAVDNSSQLADVAKTIDGRLGTVQ